MTNKEFKYWVDGYLALSNEAMLDKHQLDIIINHAELVKTISKELEPDILTFLEKIKLHSSVHSEIKKDVFGTLFSETILDVHAKSEA